MEFKDSQTYKNLYTAFKGEVQAAGKYDLFSHKAEDDHYMQIANIFEETSGNEREHAEIWYKLLNGGEMPHTVDNLKNAAEGEHYEWSEMYKSFAHTAKEEGYDQIAGLFEGVGAIEYMHDKRFRKLADNIEQGNAFCKKEEHIWICTNCGTLYRGNCAPSRCPVCGYPQGYFELQCINY